MVFSHVLTLVVFFLSFAVASVRGLQEKRQSFANALEQNKLNESLQTFETAIEPSAEGLRLLFGIGNSCVRNRKRGAGGGPTMARRLPWLRIRRTSSLQLWHGLLPVLICFAVVLYVRGQRLLAALMLVAALPLLHEIFLTGRRQFFLPALIVILMWRLYGSKKRLSWISLAGVVAVVLVFFGLQFSLRQSVTGDEVTIKESTLEGSLAPQLGEFVAGGAISLSSYPVVEERGVTYGNQFAVTVLNAVPFAKLGNALFPAVKQQFVEILSTRGTDWRFVHDRRVLFVLRNSGCNHSSFAMAILARKFHRQLIDFYSRRRFSATNILLVSVGCVLIGEIQERCK